MDESIRNKFNHLAALCRNPLADINNINRLKRDLEWINVANYGPEDWQLYHQVFK